MYSYQSQHDVANTLLSFQQNENEQDEEPFDNLGDLVFEENNEIIDEDQEDYFNDKTTSNKLTKKRKVSSTSSKVEITWTTTLCDTFVAIVINSNAHRKTVNQTIGSKWLTVLERIKSSFIFKTLG